MLLPISSENVIWSTCINWPHFFPIVIEKEIDQFHLFKVALLKLFNSSWQKFRWQRLSIREIQNKDGGTGAKITAGWQNLVLAGQKYLFAI